MHVYFSGIGAGTGPLALLAHKAGYTISGSDKQSNDYVDYLVKHTGASITIGQSTESIAALHSSNPIDWLVYSSAVIKEQPSHPEITFAKDNGIRVTKRDEFLNMLLEKSGQQMIAIAGTHGKTTTTAMMIWLMKELHLPVSYSVGAKLTFGDMGEFDPKAQYFVYEADEYDRNFLMYRPVCSLITGIAYDHADIYTTKQEYDEAFQQFATQSNSVIAWREDTDSSLYYSAPELLISIDESDIPASLSLVGLVNRRNAWQVITAANSLFGESTERYTEIMNRFPGVQRRFERIQENIYTDYAHTPEKIRGAINVAQETAGNHVVVVYEGLHNTRQHFIKDQLPTLFRGVKKLYIVPSYLAREDESLEPLTPEKLCEIINEPAEHCASQLDTSLAEIITDHAKNGDLVLCLTAGGGGSLDEWLRKELA